MEEVKVVIELTKSEYMRIRMAKSVPDMFGVDIVNGMLAIQNGTPCDDSGDQISRSALKNYWENRILKDCSYISSEEILQSIDDATTVEARPQGKWELVNPLQENDEGAYMCSVCRTGDWCISPEFKFCPYCGAKMLEETRND